MQTNCNSMNKFKLKIKKKCCFCKREKKGCVLYFEIQIIFVCKNFLNFYLQCCRFTHVQKKLKCQK